MGECGFRGSNAQRLVERMQIHGVRGEAVCGKV